MTFDELKQAILDSSWKSGLCEEYHTVKIATNYQELIDATIPLFLYGWTKGIVNTAILDEVDNDLLQANGIYYNRTGVVPEPTIPKAWFDGNDIYIIGGDPIVSFNGLLKNKLTVVSSNPIINVNDTAYLRLEAYNTQGTLNSAVNAVSHSTIMNRDASAFVVNIEGDAAVFLDYYSQLILTIGDDARVKLFSEKNSLTTVNIESTDLRIFAIASGKSQINYYES